MCDVPSELVWEILVNLPAKSVFRLRSVCKEWVRIIDDSSFIKAHANNQLYNHTLVVSNDSWSPVHSFSLDSLNFINGPQMIDATPIKNLNPRTGNLSTSVAPCNGLILFKSYKVMSGAGREMLVIRNPLTKEYHELPQPNDALTNAYGYAYGFGYDSGSDDYKVVRIDYLSYSLGKFVFQTLVYSLKSDSWRKIEDCPCSVGWKGALLDGALYWISHDDRIIVTLDLGTERYCQLPLPPDTDNCVGTISLDALDGCLICSLDYYRASAFDGWVMKDNGVEKSWIKLFSLQNSVFHGLRLVAYLKRKEQVVLHHLGGFLWYDIGNNSIKKFSIPGWNITSSLVCPGSLVRLSHYRGGDTTLLGKRRKKKKNTKTKRTDTRLKFCVRNAGEMCCSDTLFCSEECLFAILREFKSPSQFT